jgi:hypothetical protein
MEAEGIGKEEVAVGAPPMVWPEAIQSQGEEAP